MKSHKILNVFALLLVSVLLSCQSVVRVPHQAAGIDSPRTSGPEYIRAAILSGRLRSLSAERLAIAAKRWQIAIEGARNSGRAIPVLERIEAKQTALLVVDMQRAFLDIGASIEVPEGRKIVPSINRLAAAVRDKGGRVVFFRYLVNDHVGLLKHFEGKSYLGANRESPMNALRAGHPQFELYPELDVRKTDTIMDKTRYSAVFGSGIIEFLKKHRIQNVIVTGVTTDVCAGNTAESLMQMDFNVVMVWDGTAALDRLEHELYLARIFGLYGDVMPTSEVIARLD